MRATKKMASSFNEEQFDQLRRGPWTLDEDNLLIQYISCHGEGRWNSVAKSSGLKRTGKSCRLRWLNYLKPDVKRGNLTPQEQLQILELHSKWGNRWSRIALHLPGRTDNEIKNYWRTRVQKQARHLKIDSNSKKFVEALKRFWVPRLLEKVDQSSSSSPTTSATSNSTIEANQKNLSPQPQAKQSPTTTSSPQTISNIDNINSSSSICSSHIFKTSHPQTNPYHTNDCYYVDLNNFDMMDLKQLDMQDVRSSGMSTSEFHMVDSNWMSDDLTNDTFWNMDELWQFKM